MMYDTPVSLQEHCVNFVCDHLTVYCEQKIETGDSKHEKLIFKDPELHLNTDLSEQFLKALSEKRKLNDRFMSLFDPGVTVLRRVIILESTVTYEGLCILQGHHLTHLEITRFTDDIFRCMGEWTKSHLRVLNISGSYWDITDDDTPYSGVTSLKRLGGSLHTLNVSSTGFDQEGLKIVAENLSCLEVLDISCTQVKDISPLVKCKNRLKSLTMYNLRLIRQSDPVSTVGELNRLVHLDVSALPLFTSEQMFDRKYFSVPDYLSRPEVNPNLLSLDISGAEEVHPSVLKSFLEAHPLLNFLGLVQTTLSMCEILQAESEWHKAHQGLKIAGEATEDQVMESLRRHLFRSEFLEVALNTLLRLTEDEDFQQPREDIIQLILPVMRRHHKLLEVQEPAVVCLNNLTNNSKCLRIHPKLLSECIEATLTAMETFPDDRKLQRHTLATLGNDEIRNIKFERSRCYNLVMSCLHKFNDDYIVDMSAWICLTIAISLSTKETAVLGPNADNMEKLLSLVRGKMKYFDSDYTLTNTVGLIWCLTEDCPQACHVFITKGGFEVMAELLQLSEVSRTGNGAELRLFILGVLSGVAAVKSLRDKLMQQDFLKLIRRMLRGHEANISFFAAFILTHLCLEGDAPWTNIDGLERDDIIGDLKTTIFSWDLSRKNLGRFKSFQAMYLTLESSEPALHLWAVWAIHYFCTVEGDIYIPFLDKDGQKYVENLMMSDNIDPKVKAMCQDVLEMLRKHRKPKHDVSQD